MHVTIPLISKLAVVTALLLCTLSVDASVYVLACLLRTHACTLSVSTDYIEYTEDQWCYYATAA
jgi:hypothetical protein